MRRVDGDKDFVPFAVVHAGADEDSFPLVEKRRVEIESPVHKVQDVTVGTQRAVKSSSECEDAVGQSCSESQLNVVAFFSGCLNRNQTSINQTHCADRFASFTVKSILTRTVELVIGFVLKVRFAKAVVLAGRRVTASELNGTVLSAIFSVAVANVIVSAIDASSVLARSRFALINVFLKFLVLITYYNYTIIDS